ncbi:glycine-rich domain-containing protein [Flavobacterium sp.]|uniref:glycine-rich domain-containing protein n=1 Tax=Flavobacterium sp. TaxID=239 RepID=UPI0040347892
MTTVEKQLWDKLERFGFDSKGTQLTFARRLARENGWSTGYTGRVIEEYKKFIFLCCVSPTQVTPSDPVDQAWHLHLTYTRSYWDDLCDNTLSRKLHHNPTRGGNSEREKFVGYYTSLKDIYLEKFGATPPTDIWQGNNERFSEISFRRVSLDRYWLVPKPRRSLRQGVLQTLLIAGALVCVQAETGAIFFIVFLVGFIIALAFRNNNKCKGGKNSADGGSIDSSGGFFGLFCDPECSSDSGGDSGCSGCGGGCGGD